MNLFVLSIAIKKTRVDLDCTTLLLRGRGGEQSIDQPILTQGSQFASFFELISSRTRYKVNSSIASQQFFWKGD